MSLADELHERVGEIFRKQWETRDGQVVPESESVKLANEAVVLDEATVLYADMSDSTKLVESHTWRYAAEVYKAFLYCAARIIGSEDGTVTAYDGDRVMAVYLGSSKNSCAARSALKINYCSQEIVTPLLQSVYKDDYRLRHVVGIDTSPLHVARTGVRGANDLVWVGRAANYAAKLSSLSDDFPTLITADVYEKLNYSLKTSSDGRSMWEAATWKGMNDLPIYRSTWRWKVE